MNLQTPLHMGSRALKMYATRLQKLAIVTHEDLLYHFPFRYEDYSLISKIAEVQEGETVTIQGRITNITNEFTKRFKKIQKTVITDGSGEIEVVWFNQPYLTKVIHKNDFFSISGKVTSFGHKKIIESPEYELISPNSMEQHDNRYQTIHTARLVPVYPETHGVSSKWLRRQIFQLLAQYKETISEYLPDSIISSNDLIEAASAIEQIHFPKSIEEAKNARLRLQFDELFLLQLHALKRKQEWKNHAKSITLRVQEFKDTVNEFIRQLPFTLTTSQQKALEDIFRDVSSPQSMNRLLEGDVGSGKTIVAAISMYLAFLNGYQAVMMAPTEILAQQHYKTIFDLLSPIGVKIHLATGSKKFQIPNSKYQVNTNKQKKWKFDILIGTHAVLSEHVQFDKLGFIVIDEQQRFGVEQRGIIRQKGHNPHVLTMTATPIPRTVALTLYGDLDLTILTELPKGRKLIKTWLVPPYKRNGAYDWIKREIHTNRSQAFIICPFIEESLPARFAARRAVRQGDNVKSVKAAVKEFEFLQKNVFHSFQLGLLHGKLKTKEKDQVLKDFKEKKIDILVATPVVEVGIDIPNATIIVIEAAERFGLSQLHQMRGRVGRGNKQSYCLLFTDSKNEETISRLKAMETLHNGAELAELDLKLRGAGDVYGTMQHGRFKLKIADLSNIVLIHKARVEAQKILPRLSEFPALIQKLEATKTENISPD